jgi:hypothetical protein
MEGRTKRESGTEWKTERQRTLEWPDSGRAGRLYRRLAQVFPIALYLASDLQPQNISLRISSEIRFGGFLSINPNR